MTREGIRQAARLLGSATYAVALTGAGLSTASGIPDFRSPMSGLWQQIDPLLTASIWSFHEEPERFYRWFMPVARKIRSARPNVAHAALADLEGAGRLQLLITQNVDNLHQLAGSARVLELHGHLRSATCLDCHRPELVAAFWLQVDGGQIARCSHCQGLLKPDVTLIGEPLNHEVLQAAQQAALTCDVMLVIGTTLEVEPAADLPYLARRRGARLILVNREPTRADSIADVVVGGDVNVVLPRLAAACRDLA